MPKITLPKARVDAEQVSTTIGTKTCRSVEPASALADVRDQLQSILRDEHSAGDSQDE